MKKDLAVAYSVKRKNRKKYAKGGSVSAADEQRPMPDQVHDDAAMVARNSSKHPLKDSNVLESRSNDSRKIMPIKHPRMVPSNAFSVKLRDQEDNQIESFKPNEGPQEQPPEMYNEKRADRQGPAVPDMQRQHNNGRKPYAEGGEVSPQDEIDMDHQDSIAAAIMAKRKAAEILNSDSDIDEMVMMADGGILSHDSIYSDDSSQADLARNAQEDANEEDQLSFNALRKENYSESVGLRKMSSPRDSNLHGDEREAAESDSHDKIDKMRSRMNMRRQFKQR